MGTAAVVVESHRHPRDPHAQLAMPHHASPSWPWGVRLQMDPVAPFVFTEQRIDLQSASWSHVHISLVL